jgi:hypothetical protein
VDARNEWLVVDEQSLAKEHLELELKKTNR